MHICSSLGISAGRKQFRKQTRKRLQSQYRAPEFLQFKARLSCEDPASWARYGLHSRSASNLTKR